LIFHGSHSWRTNRHKRTNFNSTSTQPRRWAQIAKQGAYKLAVDLDDWFLARKELNEVPQKFKDEKRQGFIENLAKNQES
jgi:hypothetical protein